MGPTPEALALADFLIGRFGLTVDRYLLAYALMEHIEREFGAELDAEDAATPQPSAEGLRELVQWGRSDKPDDAHSTSLWDQGYAHGKNEFADKLESLLAGGGSRE